MNFSYEELYYMYGQYDKFVTLEFHFKNEAYNKFKESLMGTFVYTLEERRELEKVLKQQPIPRTDKFVRFELSELEYKHLTPAVIDEIQNNGILCSWICSIMSSNRPVENRFKAAGNRDLPNELKIYVKDDVPIELLKLGMFGDRIRDGRSLMEFEEDEYIGLSLLLRPHLVKNYPKERIYESDGKFKDSIRYHYLIPLIEREKATPEQADDFVTLYKAKMRIKRNILKKEFQRSHERLSSLSVQYKDSIRSLLNVCYDFDDETLQPYEFPIWWDFERFVHIYMRHVAETKAGERFEEKTIFSYKFRYIRHIINIVLGFVYEDIKKHFASDPDKIFIRRGSQAVYYDGIYYRVEVEPNGRLRTFHPYNDGNEMKSDI